MPVDPNMELLPDSSIVMLAIMETGTLQQVHALHSTNGGFTFQYIGPAFSVSGQSLYDPENYRFANDNWQLYAGNLTLNNSLKATSTTGNPVFTNSVAFCSAVSNIPPDCYIVADITNIGGGIYKMYAFGNAGVTGDAIVSLHSNNAGNTWALESGLRLQLTTPSAVESGRVATPTVVHAQNGPFIMVYETYIPVPGCSTTITGLNLMPVNFGGSAAVNDSVYLSVQANYSDGTIRNVTGFVSWQISNPAVATLLPNGGVKALAAGTTQITATYNGITGNAFVLNVTGGGGNGPWNADLVICNSPDGTTFNNCRIFIDSAGVASVIKKNNGQLIAAFQWFPAPIGSAYWDKVAVCTSDDNGNTWTAPVPASFPDLPEGYQRPFDPTLALTETGNIRMYFSSSENGNQPLNSSVHTYSAISADGGFTYQFEPGIRFQYPNQATIDPAAVLHNGTWYYTTPAGAPQDGAHRAIAEDGLNFTQLADIPSDAQHNWTGNLLSLPDELRFYGTGNPLWFTATTNGGNTWSNYTNTNLKGGDPAVVKTNNNQYVIIFTGFRCTTPTVVSGSGIACGGNTTVYSVPASAGAQYFWSVTGGTIVSGQGTNEIAVQWNPGSGQGQVSVLQMN
ncbi:hypothetical protein BVG80_12190 [Sphingobacteriales bacterium TSM_CSM]|nr:hypothetical protein BVG80_12190 [Sphingobacteriales bacterium TSM_CSM]